MSLCHVTLSCHSDMSLWHVTLPCHSAMSLPCHSAMSLCHVTLPCRSAFGAISVAPSVLLLLYNIDTVLVPPCVGDGWSGPGTYCNVLPHLPPTSSLNKPLWYTNTWDKTPLVLGHSASPYRHNYTIIIIIIMIIFIHRKGNIMNHVIK